MGRVRGGKRIVGGEFSGAMGMILQSYTDDVRQAITDEVEETSKELLKKVEEDSHKVTGDYAKGWKLRRQDVKRSSRFSVTYVRFVIYNKFYWLTHLLERGHLTRDGKRTKAYPHIIQNKEEAEQKLMSKIGEVIDKV